MKKKLRVQFFEYFFSFSMKQLSVKLYAIFHHTHVCMSNGLIKVKRKEVLSELINKHIFLSPVDRNMQMMKIIFYFKKQLKQ